MAEASKRDDKAGADAFYIQAINEQNRGNSQTVYVDLYHKEAPKADATPVQRTFDGIRELPRYDVY
ncbi:YdgH/BhsA/McbA-like domain containing protein [Candidatus Symbiopectobacterium sp.]|uniref:YdgH/BhsA/McbA-like domain containing protein n=1 Tax=Candidatus Symbiopectobacterium sp. TaxID=2816440 RepID=UPI0025BC218D|nr:YdgH/BhsA/McbA-like domain containing protein [Candidatus Symbiopectobacterium sp.]